MDDKTDVGLVDAHTEGNGGNNNIGLITLECLLGCVAVFVGETRVVRKRPNSVVLEERCCLLDPTTAETVNDPALPLPTAYEREDFLSGVPRPLLSATYVQIRSEKTNP